MKPLFAASLIMLSLPCIAQQATDQSIPKEFYPAKSVDAFISLDNGNVVKGRITRITDSVVSIQGTDISAERDLPIPGIQAIKLKRKEIGTRTLGVAILAGFVGYGLGVIAYSFDNRTPHDDVKEKALGAAFIAAVPGAFIGLVSGVLIKKKFTINGRRNKLDKVIKALQY